MMHISYYFESNLHVNQLIAKCQKITFPIAYSPPALQWVSNKNDPNQKHKTLVTCKNEQPWIQHSYLGIILSELAAHEFIFLELFKLCL